MFSFLHAWYKEMTLQRYINYGFRGDFYLLRFRLKMIQICEEILIFFVSEKYCSYLKVFDAAGVLFSTLFSVFGDLLKHGLLCLMYHLKKQNCSDPRKEYCLPLR